MRVAVFRAAADGARTAERLGALGHAAVLAPVIRIARSDVAVASDGIDAVIFTSAHAPEVLDGDPALPALLDLPCWCVGARTARTARARGFSQVETGPGDAAGLADRLEARHRSPMRLLVLAGRDRKPILEDRLSRGGHSLRVAEVYEAEAIPAWSPAAIEQLRGCEAALHYSRRSADLAARLAVAHALGDPLRAWQHHCLSGDVAAALQAHALPHLVTADAPDEAHLLATLPRRLRPLPI